jgi:hypothetical protein
MNTSKDFLDPCYTELNKRWFELRMNHYNRMIKWLVIANIIAWSAVAYISIK